MIEGKKMSIKKFIIKTAVKTVVFAVLSTIALSLLQSPVISNNIALGQMENSDVLYVLWDTYNKIRPIVTVIYSLIVLWFVGTVGYDVYKFITQKIKEKKENEV
jgi:hypothetical protein